jgi:hypothetical protein
VIHQIQQPDVRGGGPSTPDKIHYWHTTYQCQVRTLQAFAGYKSLLVTSLQVNCAALSDGLRWIFAAVYDDCSEPLAAILVSGEASRVPNDRLLILVKLAQEVAELTMALDSTTPDAKSFCEKIPDRDLHAMRAACRVRAIDNSSSKMFHFKIGPID